MSYELTDAVFASSVPAPERFTLLMLAHVTRPGMYRSWPSVDHLAVLIGGDARTVKRHLHKLEANGYIKREHRANTSTVYTINVGHLGDARPVASPSKEIEPPEDPPPGQYVDPFGPWEDESTSGQSVHPPVPDLSPHPVTDSTAPRDNLPSPSGQSVQSGVTKPTPEQVREQVTEEVKEQGKDSLPLDTPKPQPKTSKRRKPETPLPDDWQPTEDHRIYAARYQLDVDREAERFRNHAAMKDRRVRDWNAAFRNWLDKAREFAPAANAVKPGQEAWRRYCEQ